MTNMTQTTLLTPAEIAPAREMAGRVIEQLDRILLGRHELHKMALVGILSRGHILLEGLPGLGKTALVRAMGDVLTLKFSRVQFTPDLMPSDILGAHILQETSPGKREMIFQPGPVFTNILLADEINRASPKTQSAMLETMQERTVTLLGVTRPLPSPFFVLASQNPIELEGTYPLPEAQLDRFLFKLMVTDVNVDVLTDIIGTRRRGESPKSEWAMSAEQLNSLFTTMDRIFMPKPVARYIARLVAATHADYLETPADIRDYIAYGCSPRAAIAIAEAARAVALIEGRPTAGFEDVRVVATAVINHRLILNYKAKFDRVDTMTVIRRILEVTKESEADLPDDILVKKGDA